MNNLAKIRNEKGITQQEISTSTGFTQGQISRWENGKSFSLTTATKLAAALNVSIDELMGGCSKNEITGISERSNPDA